MIFSKHWITRSNYKDIKYEQGKHLMSTSEQLSSRFFPQDKFFSILAQAECWIWLPCTKEEHYTVNLRKLQTPEYTIKRKMLGSGGMKKEPFQ